MIMNQVLYTVLQEPIPEKPFPQNMVTMYFGTGGKFQYVHASTLLSLRN